MSVEKTHTLWVVTPVVDLSCITLGWLLFFFAPYLFPKYFDTIRIVSVTFLFATHRYFTFLLVYLDRAEFSRARVLLPLLSAAFSMVFTPIPFLPSSFLPMGLRLPTLFWMV